MTLTLQLPDELEAELAEEAARMGVPLSEYALRVLQSRSSAPVNIRTGADLVAFWEAEGVMGNRPDITDPAGHSRKLRREAEHRRRS